MAVPKKYSHIDFSPTKQMRRNAEAGLKKRDNLGRGGTQVGVRRANQLKRGDDLTPKTVRRMKSYFSRHSGDNLDEKDSNGWVAWQLWGGYAGQSWANARVKQMDAADE